MIIKCSLLSKEYGVKGSNKENSSCKLDSRSNMAQSENHSLSTLVEYVHVEPNQRTALIHTRRFSCRQKRKSM
jgi:hypothetical protein